MARNSIRISLQLARSIHVNEQCSNVFSAIGSSKLVARRSLLPLTDSNDCSDFSTAVKETNQGEYVETV